MKKPTRHMFSFLRMMNEGYNAHVHFQPNILSPNRTSKCGCGFSMGTVDGLIARKLIEERSSRAAKNRHGVFKLTPTGRKLVKEHFASSADAFWLKMKPFRISSELGEN